MEVSSRSHASSLWCCSRRRRQVISSGGRRGRANNNGQQLPLVVVVSAALTRGRLLAAAAGARTQTAKFDRQRGGRLVLLVEGKRRHPHTRARLGATHAPQWPRNTRRLAAAATKEPPGSLRSLPRWRRCQPAVRLVRPVAAAAAAVAKEAST
jgi:hypothetical protein